ncbi:MAG: nucleotidyltransferase substrate binding protein [Sulfuritalea sp.]|nr:nucleotidyltransferase substrate binding protein [Sulfuritalea sp.]
MTNNPDIRWQQRCSNFQRAFASLAAAVGLARARPLSDLEKQGLIQAFEFTHELAWNVMRDYFAYQGNAAITGSRDAVREAFSKGLLDDGEGWMEMISSRNLTSHTYNQAVADEIVARIMGSYFELFEVFLARMINLAQDGGT